MNITIKKIILFLGILPIFFILHFIGNYLKGISVEGLGLLNKTDAFCEVNKGFELEKQCNALTETNCNTTSCCVWTSNKKCKSGDISGAVFNTDANGKTEIPEYYYYKNKCYGEKC
jgi:hypothetical protein